MKKITLFVAAFLMSSVAFGQVNWGRFENRLDQNAKKSIEESFSKSKSNRACNGLADQVELTVTGIVESEFSLGSDQPEYDVYLGAVSVQAVVNVRAVDLYHSDKWNAQVKTCSLHPTL